MSLIDRFSLAGSVAIITGAGKGIGRAIALAYAEAGAKVVCAARTMADVEAVVAQIREQGGEAVAVQCDATDAAHRETLVEKALEAFGKITHLVNNVGGGGAGREAPTQIEVSQFEKVFKMNVFSMWRLCQLVAPHMKSSGYGSIINMSSMASINTSPAISAYASSKAAVNHMTRNIAFDYGPEIRVNAIGPGAVRTHALETVLTPEIEKKMLAHTPLGRLGEADDIAGAVLYFAAPISSWVSGQVLFVNGGGEQTLDM